MRPRCPPEVPSRTSSRLRIKQRLLAVRTLSDPRAFVRFTSAIYMLACANVPVIEGLPVHDRTKNCSDRALRGEPRRWSRPPARRPATASLSGSPLVWIVPALERHDQHVLVIVLPKGPLYYAAVLRCLILRSPFCCIDGRHSCPQNPRNLPAAGETSAALGKSPIRRASFGALPTLYTPQHVQPGGHGLKPD